MRRLIPFLLRSKRRLRLVPKAPRPEAAASVETVARPFQARKDHRKTPDLRLLQPDKT